MSSYPAKRGPDPGSRPATVSNNRSLTLSRIIDARVPTPESTDDNGTILVVERDASLRSTLLLVLTSAGYTVYPAAGAGDAHGVLQRENIDLVLTNIGTPAPGGESLVAQLRNIFPDVPVIGITSHDSLRRATSITCLGAAEYLIKPLNPSAMLDAVQRVLRAWAPQRERRRAALLGGEHLRGIIGRSRPMRALFQQLARVAPSSAPVLIAGETGVGKELIARAVQRISGRAPFVPVNCGAIPPSLIEAELFGHIRGAFTGADRDRVGLFEAADGGTLFLDEIAELPLQLQPKLLRVLQSGEFRRVGEVKTRTASVRIIAASHRDLRAAVTAGDFREDLYYRINVLRLDVPPLRERTSDIPLLADQFLAAVARREQLPVKHFTPGALAHLIAYPWPGNVRELENVVERAALLIDDAAIDIADLPAELRGAAGGTAIFQRLGQELTLAEIEREHILGVLERVHGNRSRAAEVLGVPRRTLYRRLEEYGLLAAR